MVEKRNYYVGEPTYSDPTSRRVFGDPLLKPVEDGGWIPCPANRFHAEPESITVTTIYLETAHIQRHQISPDVSITRDKPKLPTETARRLTEIQTQLTTMRASMGRKFRHSAEANDLKSEYQVLANDRRREKRARQEVLQ